MITVKKGLFWISSIKSHNFKFNGIILKHNELRQEAAQAYNQRLSEISGLTTPLWDENRKSVFHLYVVRVKDRDIVRAKLSEQEIQTGIHYPVPPHLQGAYNHLGYTPGAFPVTEKFAGEILSLPMYPEMSREMVEYVADMLKNIVTE